MLFRSVQTSPVRAAWIAGITNDADGLSRAVHPPSYSLNRAILRAACRKLRVVPSIDLFASDANHQLNTWRTAEHDGFAMNWRGLDTPFANPPWNIAGDVLIKAAREKVERMLIVLPVWERVVVALTDSADDTEGGPAAARADLLAGGSADTDAGHRQTVDVPFNPPQNVN